jgi:hypothetical protein
MGDENEFLFTSDFVGARAVYTSAGRIKFVVNLVCKLPQPHCEIALNSGGTVCNHSVNYYFVD